MTVEDYLRDKGLQYKITSGKNGLEAKLECPKCGKNEFQINLNNGVYNCWRKNKCGVTGNFYEFQTFYGDKGVNLDNGYVIHQPKTYDKPTKELEPINAPVYEYFKTRGICEGTVKQFNIGFISGNIAFQYHKNGAYLNCKYRSIKEKKFYQEKNCMPTLWNQDNIKGERLIIVEGEIDCMSLAELGIESVSVPSGASNMDWIENDWDFINKFNEVFLFMDSDEAGQNAVQILTNRIGVEKCRNITLKKYKDANECLEAGITFEQMEQIINNASHYNRAEIKKPLDFLSDIIELRNNPEKRYGITASFTKLNDILKGWRVSEITIWTGSNGAGKSTILTQEMIYLASIGQKVCISSFEMAPDILLDWMLSQYDGKYEMSNKEIEQSLKEINANIWIIDIQDSIEKELLFDIMGFCSRRYAINHFVVDSLMKVSLTTNQERFYGEQKNFVSEMKQFVVKNKTHVHLVAHPRKGSKDDDFVGKVDVSGTANITDLADNVITLHRYSKKQKELLISEDGINPPYDSLMTLAKNRAFGETGSIGLFFYKESRRFSIEAPMFEIPEQRVHLS